MKRLLLFELCFPDGKIARLYSDGEHEGLPDGTFVPNRAGPILDAIEANGGAVPEGVDLLAPALTPEFGKAHRDREVLSRAAAA